MASTINDDIPARDLEPADVPSAREAYGFVLTVFGLFGVIALVVAVLVGTGGSDGTAASTASQPTAVSLTEFAISPAAVTASTTGGIHVTNNGNVQHNLRVEGTDVATKMIDAGGSEHLDLSSLAPGEYTLFCEVPGHKDAGMSAPLHLTQGTGEAAASMPGMDMTTSSSMSPEEMDKAMEASLAAFPAKTEGVGAQLLAPTVLPDGTKQFELTTAVTKWEVSPGKFVDAMTYNGTVPGPTIKVDPGDHVKIVLHNKLPESTSIHFHGLITPNSMDGTTYVTQDPVLPGQDFTYEWTVQDTPAVGMYHSHHIAFQQVPDGLAGAFLVGEMPVPSGVTVTQEQIMMLDDSGVIGYALNGKSFPATAPVVATQGEWIVMHYLNEGTQIHPMHLHGMAQVVIAKDGFPVANPQPEDTVTVAPGERFTVLIHATEPGTWVWHCHILPHAENENGMFGMVTALVVK
jgi:FtsP/CotA-like multicopper oxidase with cupredoxin domain/plastocyanin